MTRSSVFCVTLLATALLLSLVVSNTSRVAAQDDGPFAAYIGFTDAQLRPDRAAVRAFVPTGSLSPICLATLSESTNPVPGTTVFCAPRSFNGQNGILVSLFFPQPMPTGFFVSATVHQDHANTYGSPVFYPGI
jgi:hypothetical protein